MIYDVSGQNQITTLYVNQPVNLPPLTAQAAFDAVRGATASPETPNKSVIATGRGELHLVETGRVDHQGALWPLRRASGRLCPTGPLGSMRVEVEVTPWSKLRCEVGIRPCGRMAPLKEGWRQHRYFAAAIEAAEQLARRLEAVVEDWIVEQLVAPAGELAHRL
jgi:hypothetical protein